MISSAHFWVGYEAEYLAKCLGIGLGVVLSHPRLCSVLRQPAQTPQGDTNRRLWRARTRHHKPEQNFRSTIVIHL
jgi:hypothetical protein